MNAVLAGIGIGLFPVTMVAPYIAAGKLQIVLPGITIAPTGAYSLSSGGF
jgi:DNA-binding transcriptional LysR family regulator